MSRKLSAVTVAALAAVTAFAFPTSALASGAGLPEGESIYAVNYSGTGTVVDIDTSGTETVLFAGNLTATYPAKTAYNPVDGCAYWFKGNFPTVLYKTDISTGISTVVGNISLGGGNPFVETLAIDSDGNGYIIADDAGTATLYSLDLSTASMTVINVVNTLINSGNSQFNVRAIAYNPADGLIYAINDESGDMQLTTVNLTGTTVTDLGAKAGNNGDDPGQWSILTFDSAGTMWSTEPSNGLWKATPASWTTTGSTLASTQALATDSQNSYIFVAYTVPDDSNGGSEGSGLANTGMNNGLLVGSVGLALVAMLVGAGLITARRRTH